MHAFLRGPLGLGTHNPRFVAWALKLEWGLTIHALLRGPCVDSQSMLFCVAPRVGVGLTPRFVAWPLELGLGTHNHALLRGPSS